MRKLQILTLASLLLLYGCGTSKRAAKTAADPSFGLEVQHVQDHPKVLYPIGYEPITEDDPKTETSQQRVVTRIDRPQITFTDSQSAHVRLRGINPLPADGLVLSLDEMKNEFVFPYKGRFLSDYGMRGSAMHTGVDIKTIPNDTIRAAFAGVVRMSKNYSGYGNIVVIRHYQGFETAYAHCSRNLVKVNDVVEAGDPIGLGGRTGRATTEHLHFEVRADGEHINPNLLIDVHNQTLKSGTLYIRQQGDKIVATNTAGVPQDDDFYDISRQRADAGSNAGSSSQVTNAATAGRTSASATSSAQTTYHTVKQGDTLYALSRKYGTTVKKLCELNNIRENSILRLGQKLRVK